MSRSHDDDNRPDRPGLSRRGFLEVLGLGAGSLAVAGAGGLTWRATQAGVFAAGTGPAYAAWNQWNRPGDGVLNLVRAGVLAANAHNTQPWLFRATTDRLDLYADPARGMGSMDPLHREMDLSLGCALENVVLAGPPNGLAPMVTLMPDPAQPSHVAHVTFDTTAATRSPLFAAIPTRHTNRGPYETDRPLGTDTIAALIDLIDIDTTRLVWFTTAEDKHAFGELTVQATEAIIADPQQAVDDFAWYRTSWQQIQSTKDGITIDASGQPPLIRAAAKLLGASRTTTGGSRPPATSK